MYCLYCTVFFLIGHCANKELEGWAPRNCWNFVNMGITKTECAPETSCGMHLNHYIRPSSPVMR